MIANHRDGATLSFAHARTKTGAFVSASPDPIRILTVDDHPLLRAGIGRSSPASRTCKWSPSAQADGTLFSSSAHIVPM
jgi:hypothetical protein